MLYLHDGNKFDSLYYEAYWRHMKLNWSLTYDRDSDFFLIDNTNLEQTRAGSKHCKLANVTIFNKTQANGGLPSYDLRFNCESYPLDIMIELKEERTELSYMWLRK
eukprot:TRINITY_DN3534_c0_g1_i4.p2 TRINITY_DN3534_c0_g1~~TRINITY_DN3534_c0_g1_i4.p2  ORF type:complete len:106 (+),score=8.82 TRINITY_DN3534_c0_g1_i4:285-602(+)